MVEANVNALAAASPAAGAGARALDLPFLVSLAKWSETWTLWLPLAPALMMMMSFICICTHCLKLICTHWLTLPSAHSSTQHTQLRVGSKGDRRRAAVYARDMLTPVPLCAGAPHAVQHACLLLGDALMFDEARTHVIGRFPLHRASSPDLTRQCLACAPDTRHTSHETRESLALPVASLCSSRQRVCVWVSTAGRVRVVCLQQGLAVGLQQGLGSCSNRRPLPVPCLQ